jgi:hypothetical protein
MANFIASSKHQREPIFFFSGDGAIRADLVVSAVQELVEIALDHLLLRVHNHPVELSAVKSCKQCDRFVKNRPILSKIAQNGALLNIRFFIPNKSKSKFSKLKDKK